MNDSVRLVEERFAGLVEDRVTEIRTAAQNSIQKVNTEIKNFREKLSSRQLTDCAIPNQVLPLMVGDVENSIQSISVVVNSAGNYYVGNGNANNYTTSACGNVTSQPSVSSISGSAIVDVERTRVPTSANESQGNSLKVIQLKKTQNLNKFATQMN